MEGGRTQPLPMTSYAKLIVEIVQETEFLQF